MVKVSIIFSQSNRYLQITCLVQQSVQIQRYAIWKTEMNRKSAYLRSWKQQMYGILLKTIQNRNIGNNPKSTLYYTVCIALVYFTLVYYYNDASLTLVIFSQVQWSNRKPIRGLLKTNKIDEWGSLHHYSSIPNSGNNSFTVKVT